MYQNYDNNRHICLTSNKIKHCEEVAKYMYDYAIFFNINPDIAYFTGLNHDIGYLNGKDNHGENGAKLLSSLGVDSDIVFAIKNHGKDPLLVGTEVSPLLELLWCADLSVNALGERVGFSKRLEDIEKRYGEDSVAFETAKKTVIYCRSVIADKTIIKPEELHIDFTAELNNRFNINLPISEKDKKVVYLKEFGIDIDFIRKYALPEPDIYIKGSISDSNKADVRLYLKKDKKESSFFNSIEAALKIKNTSKIEQTLCLNAKELPQEFYSELLNVCKNIKSGYDGTNSHTHNRMINSIFEQKYELYEQISNIDSIDNIER